MTKQTTTQVPDEYKWKAQDDMGFWYAFTAKPTPVDSDQCWRVMGAFIELGQGDPNPNWRDSLEEI